MGTIHILVVEDEEAIQELITYHLRKEGFKVTCVATGEDAVVKIRNEEFNLVLLDLMLPGIDGLEVCRAVRKHPAGENVPIMMVTAKGEESDVVAGLELGADDYMVKPFSPRVLVARVKTLLRRRRKGTAETGAPIEIHDVAIHPGRHEVTIAKKPVTLTNMEFRVLYFLASQPGWVLSRYQIVEGVRGENYPVTDRSVDVIITGLRKKLGPTGGELIETVRGVGYRFKEEA